MKREKEMLRELKEKYKDDEMIKYIFFS